MRRDLNATLQMGNSFADTKEEESWQAENKDISNLTHPFSGSERNRLFLSRAGKQFLDVSGLSGVDSPADGRVSVWLDYDRDGRQDLAVINSSHPLLQIYHNNIGGSDESTRNHFIAVQVVGGNLVAKPSDHFSNRDGFGAKVRVHVGDQILLREHYPSQGLAGQNSRFILIGIGEATSVDEVEIAWPSGRSQTVNDVTAGTLVTAFENPDDRPEGSAAGAPEGFVLERWTRDATPVHDTTASTTDEFELALDPGPYLNAADGDRPEPELLVVSMMASWCVSCARHQPSVNELRQSFSAEEAEVIGFAVDPDDPAESVEEFLRRHRADYPAIVVPTDSLRAGVDRILDESHASDALPTSIIIRRDGRVVRVTGGIPSVSELRGLLTTASE